MLIVVLLDHDIVFSVCIVYSVGRVSWLFFFRIILRNRSKTKHQPRHHRRSFILLRTNNRKLQKFIAARNWPSNAVTRRVYPLTICKVRFPINYCAHPCIHAQQTCVQVRLIYLTSHSHFTPYSSAISDKSILVHN